MSTPITVLVPFGNLARMYRNTSGDWDAPSWSHVDIVANLKLMRSATSVDIKIRRQQQAFAAKTGKILGVSGDFLAEINGAEAEVWDDAFDAVTPDDVFDLLILRAARTQVGARGYRGYFQVHGGEEDQGPDAVIYPTFELKPYPGTKPLYKAKVAAGPTIVYTSLAS